LPVTPVSPHTDGAAEGESPAEVRLTGTRLILARIAWTIVTLMSVGLFIVAVRDTYTSALTLSILPDAAQRDIAREGFAQLGLTVEAFVAYAVGLVIARTLVFFVVGAVIFAKRSDSRMAILVSLFLMVYPAGR